MTKSRFRLFSQRIFFPFLFLVIVILCLLPLSYFTVYRWFDRELCINRTTRRLGIEDSFGAIHAYVTSSLDPGMTREQVEANLKKIGPISVENGEVGLDNIVADSIRLRMCSHPLNDILIFARYSTNGKLMSFYIVDE